MEKTIALIIGTGWMGIEDLAWKVFKDKQSAHEYENKQGENVQIRVLDGKWEVRRLIPVGTKSTAI